MKEFYKHIVVHVDIIVKAETKKEAQDIYEETHLLLDRKGIRFSGELVDEHLWDKFNNDEETTNWRILKK